MSLKPDPEGERSKKERAFLFLYLSNLFLLISLLPFQLFATSARPPLVPQGENLTDFKDLLIGEDILYNTAKFNSENTIIASGSDDGVIRIWDTKTKRLKSSFKAHDKPIHALSFSNNGDFLASSSEDNTIRIWDTNNWKQIKELAEHNDSVWTVEFSPDSTMLASGGADNTVIVWDVLSGKSFKKFHDGIRSITTVSFSHDGSMLLSGSDDNSINLWNIRNITEKNLIRSFAGHSERVRSAILSKDNKKIFSGSLDKTIRIWDTESGNTLKTLSDHKERITSLSLSPDESLIASSSADNTIKLWDVDTGRLLHTFTGHLGTVTSVSFSKKGNQIISSSTDNTIKIWNLDSKQLLFSLEVPTYSTSEKSLYMVSGAFFNKSDSQIISIGTDSIIKIWDSEKLQLRKTSNISINDVTATDYNSNSEEISSASYKNGEITISSPKNKKSTRFKTKLNPDEHISSLKFNADGSILGIGTTDGRIKIKNLKNNNIYSLTGHQNLIRSIDFHPTKKILATGSADKTIKLWDISNKNKIQQYNLSEHTAEVYAVRFSPNGKLLASGSSDKTVKIWDISSGKLTSTLTGAEETIISIAFSPSGEHIAAGLLTSSLALWNLYNKQHLTNDIGHRKEHQRAINSINFSNDGKKILTGLADNTIRIWDSTTLTLLNTLSADKSGKWISIDEVNKILLRSEDGGLLLSKNGKDWLPILPKNIDPANYLPLEPHHKNLPPNFEIASGHTKTISFQVYNPSTEIVYWPRIQLDENSNFNLHNFPGDAPYTIGPGQTIQIHAKISAHLRKGQSNNNNKAIEPYEDILKLRVTAYKQTKSPWQKIPVQVSTPKLELTEATLLEDENILKVRIDNTGTQAIENTYYKLNIPGLPTLDIQNAKEPIQPNSFIERSFSLPADFSPPKELKVNLDVRNAALPFMIWDFTAPVTLPKPPIWMYASLALLTLLAGISIFYYRRYRHPLLVDLSETPKKLLRLPLEQLPEAQHRLKQTDRLKTTLSDVSVSPKTLQQALDFHNKTAAQKAEHLAFRIGGELEKTHNDNKINDGIGTAKAPRPMRERGWGEGVLKTPPNFPLNIDKLLLCFPSGEEPEDLFHHLKTGPDANRITLIIGPNSDYQRRLYNTTKELDNKWVAPQGGEITTLLLSPNPEQALAEILAGQLSLQQISPYRVGGGVNNESVFFGRRELIAQITNRDPANYLMVGGRQVGKSTLLKALERRYTDNPQIQCHYLTLSNEVLIPRLAASLKLEKTNDPETLASQLDERIREDGQRYIFLIDEADRFIEHEKAQDYPILNVFRRLSEEGNCTFILAGFWQLYQHVVLDYQSPIRNFGELLSVGALEKLACIDLATEPMKNMNLHWENETLVEHLVTNCGQRANLIAIACQHIVRNLPPQQRTVTAGDTEQALHSDEMRRALSGWVVGETEEEQTYERMLVYATIEQENFTTADLLEMAQCHDIAVDTQQLERTLSRLELSFVLGREQGHWFYRVPLFVEYISEDAPKHKLENEIQRLKQSRTL